MKKLCLLCLLCLLFMCGSCKSSTHKEIQHAIIFCTNYYTNKFTEEVHYESVCPQCLPYKEMSSYLETKNIISLNCEFISEVSTGYSHYNHIHYCLIYTE